MDLTDPVTLFVLLGFVVFSIQQWLQWQSRQAWFDRVWLEHADESPEREE
ncbi:hypothetical protein [Natronomonas sp. EA1]